MQPRSFFYHLNNSRGNTIMMVLIISVVISITVGFLVNRIFVQQRLSQNLRSEISTTLALQSVTDYARYALKNQWCISQDLKPVPYATEGYNCYRDYGLEEPSRFNLYRLLLPEKYATKVVLLKRTMPSAVFEGTKFPTACGPAITSSSEDAGLIRTCAQAMQLSNVRIETTLAQLEQTQGEPSPLVRIIRDANLRRRGQMPLIDSVVINYDNTRLVNLPFSDDAVYVRIRTELRSGGQIIRNGSRLAAEEELVLAAPRENNYFSLILRGSIHVAQDNVATNGEGNTYIPAIDIPYEGVSFMGPVFINRNLVLPSEFRASTKKPKPYLTFFEPVVFGSGRIIESNGYGYKQPSTSGNARVWREFGPFGGFRKGFEQDGKRDAGLDAIAGDDFEVASNDIIQCINQLNERESPALTIDSKLFAVPRTPSFLMDGTTPFNMTNEWHSRRYTMGFWKRTAAAGAAPTPQKIFYPLRRIFSTTPTSSDYSIANLGSGDSSVIAASASFAATTSQDVSFTANISWSRSGVNYLKEDIPIPDEGAIVIDLKNGGSVLGKVTVRSRKIIMSVASQDYTQPHMRDVEVVVSNYAGLTGNPINYIKLRAMDNTCNLTGQGCLTDIQGGTGGNKDIYLKNFTVNGGPDTNNCLSQNLYSNTVPACATDNTRVLPAGYEFNALFNYGEQYDRCRNAGGINAGGITQNEVETDYTRYSHLGWRLPHHRDANDDMNFSTFNGTIYRASSIHNVCTVPASLDIIAGNFMCRVLKILPRNSKLTFVGTFIVLSRLDIDPSAIKHGVKFYSAHTGAEVLKQTPILRTTSGEHCRTLYSANIPFWHPSPGNKTLADRNACSPVSLFATTGTPERYPFRWTSVTADCIPYPNPAAGGDNVCIKKIKNYFFKSMERHHVRVTE